MATRKNNFLESEFKSPVTGMLTALDQRIVWPKQILWTESGWMQVSEGMTTNLFKQLISLSGFYVATERSLELLEVR